MSQFGGGGGKNPPWVRQNQAMGMGVAQQSQLQPQMMTQLGGTAAATMLQYPQAQMFQQSQLSQLQQSGMAMQTMGALGSNQIGSAATLQGSMQPPSANSIQQQAMYPQVGTVSYPTRTLITTPFGAGSASQAGAVSGGAAGGSANQGMTPKQRVFTGTVTKVQDNFGFVDEEVFFQTSCCVKGSNPQVGDRVLVEAMYNASMPFKWNATRIQVLPMERNEPVGLGGGNRNRFSNSGYNNVPPPSEDMMSGGGDFGRNRNRKRNRNDNRNDDRNDNRNNRNDNDFSRKRRDDDDDFDRKRRRSIDRKEEKEKEKEKERPKSPPPRKRSKTPRRRKARVVPRYMVQIPKIALDMPEADVMEIRKRYTNMYVPSDFFVSSFKWVEVFPPQRPLTLERPCAFHVMHKDVDPVIENDAVLDPPDIDYLFSAKVMLLSMPELDEMYKKCCALAGEEKEGSYDDRDFVHPTRLINFLVGLRGKNETMAIGGPWSPSLDGPNPDKDPTVLIKTSIRTCKALTGIDLSNCQWYRFLEIYYHRAESVHKGKTVPARVETVVLYLPDVWNCLPTRLEWDGLFLNYKKQLDRLLNQEDDAEGDDKDVSTGEVQKKEPSHFSLLDPKIMKVNELREELEARSLSSKGLKSQLTARLAKALKTEQDKEEEEKAAKAEAGKTINKEKEEKDEEKRKKEEEEKKKLDEKERQLLEKRHTLPDKSHILVHPSRTAKSGKFDCTTMSLSVLLDYRPEDSKEHSFEVSLFAELFNEMLMRDFGFCIYKALMAAPEKPKEEKDDKKDKDKDKKSDRDKKKDDEKDEKKEEKRDDKKDDKNSIEEDDGSGDDDDRKDKKDDKKKKDRAKLVTVDPYLLLAFVYFDQTHCGYIFDKDLEELLFTLGLNLSRAQVKKLVSKVISRDSLHYRKLTDKSKDDTSVKQNGGHSMEDLITLALGNKRLFPVFLEDGSSPSKRNRKGGSEKKDTTELPSGFVMYNGSMVDINKLQAQFKRSEDYRIKTEQALEKLRCEHGNLKENNARNVTAIRKLSSEVKDYKERLSNTNLELCSIDSKTKLYFSTMQEIYEKLSPIVSAKQSSIKEEHIEDVEMEDVMEPANDSKKELKSEDAPKSNSKDNSVKAASKEIPNKSEKQSKENKTDTATCEPKQEEKLPSEINSTPQEKTLSQEPTKEQESKEADSKSKEADSKSKEADSKSKDPDSKTKDPDSKSKDPDSKPVSSTKVEETSESSSQPKVDAVKEEDAKQSPTRSTRSTPIKK